MRSARAARLPLVPLVPDVSVLEEPMVLPEPVEPDEPEVLPEAPEVLPDDPLAPMLEPEPVEPDEPVEPEALGVLDDEPEVDGLLEEELEEPDGLAPIVLEPELPEAPLALVSVDEPLGVPVVEPAVGAAEAPPGLEPVVGEVGLLLAAAPPALPLAPLAPPAEPLPEDWATAKPPKARAAAAAMVVRVVLTALMSNSLI